MAMASLTPERRSSSEETPSLISQRRYSKAYEQPIVSQTPKGSYVVRESDDTHSTATGSTTSGVRPRARGRVGKVLNPETIWMGSILAKFGLGVLVFVAVSVMAVGRFPLEVASHIVGFSLVFLLAFVTCSGLFVWWGSWGSSAVSLTVKKVLVLYGVCSVSYIVSRVVIDVARLPLTDALPTAASHYILFTTLLLINFALFAHPDGLNAMFSAETVYFVGLTTLLDLMTNSIFGHFLPTVLLSQTVYLSGFLGMTLSLMGNRFQTLSLSNIYRVLKRLNHPSVVRKLSRTSSTTSSAVGHRFHRNSFSSVSSMSQFNNQVIFTLSVKPFLRSWLVNYLDAWAKMC